MCNGEYPGASVLSRRTGDEQAAIGYLPARHPSCRRKLEILAHAGLLEAGAQSRDQIAERGARHSQFASHLRDRVSLESLADVLQLRWQSGDHIRDVCRQINQVFVAAKSTAGPIGLMAVLYFGRQLNLIPVTVVDHLVKRSPAATMRPTLGRPIFEDRGAVALDDGGHEGVIVRDCRIEFPETPQQDKPEFLLDVFAIRWTEARMSGKLSGFAANQRGREFSDVRLGR